MRYRAVIFDIDGTLVPKELDAPTRRVAGAVRTLRESGCKVIIATGRSLAAAREVLGPVEADYFVTANGGRVTDEQGKCLYENPMTQEEMYALVDYCEDYEIPLLFVYPDGYYCYTEYEAYREAYASSESSLRVLFDGEDQVRHLEGLPSGAGALMSAAQLEGFQEKYGHLGLRFAPYWEGAYDIMRASTNKALSTGKLLEMLGIGWEEAAAVGDGLNDAELMEHAGFSVAMGNACEELRKAADAVAPPASEDGAAAAIETSFL